MCKEIGRPKRDVLFLISFNSQRIICDARLLKSSFQKGEEIQTMRVENSI
jgi:hypothetical protein